MFAVSQALNYGVAVNVICQFCIVAEEAKYPCQEFFLGRGSSASSNHEFP